MYLILTSKKKGKILATKDYFEARDFIKSHKDSRIRTMDHTAKTLLIDKRTFLDMYLKNTEDKKGLFSLSLILVKGNNNLRNYFRESGILKEYELFIQKTKDKL